MKTIMPPLIREEWIRRARNSLRVDLPLTTLANRIIREGIDENTAWDIIETASSRNFREAVEFAFSLLNEGDKTGTEIKRVLMKKGHSWVEANAIFEKARQIWIEEELERD